MIFLKVNGRQLFFTNLNIADSSRGIAPFFNQGTEGVKIHQEILEAAFQAKAVTKAFADGFYKTDLEKIL